MVKRAIRDVLDLDLPNMVQMDCSLLSGLLAEAITKRTPRHLDAVFFCNSGTEAMEGALKFARAAATGRKRVISLESAFHGLSLGSLSLMGCDSFTEGFGPLMDEWDTRIALDDIASLERELAKVAPHCHWTRGRWKELGDLAWNELQNVPRHVGMLSNLLVRTYLHANAGER